MRGPIRLNRFIALSGACARREADNLIAAGRIQVNGKVVTEMATKVDSRVDEVLLDGKSLQPEPLVYVLLNKPKNYITTASDPEGRRTVLELLRPKVTERVFPVGRLDRNTTGLLLLTNDGDLAEKLAHPAFEVPKLYHIKLERPVTRKDLDQLLEGIELEDGPIRADAIDWVANSQKYEVGVEIHSGRNRIVRRMFEHLGYTVKSLDRVGYAFLTKKGIARGYWRRLSEKEVNYLRMLSSKKQRPGKPTDKPTQ